MFFAMPVNTNLNKLFKEMELDKNHFHGIICIVLCTLILYPDLFIFTGSFKSLPLYVQLILTTGLSIIYNAISIPLSLIIVTGKGIFYFPIFLLGALSGIYLIYPAIHWIPQDNTDFFFLSISLAFPSIYLILLFDKKDTVAVQKKQVNPHLSMADVTYLSFSSSLSSSFLRFSIPEAFHPITIKAIRTIQNTKGKLPIFLISSSIFFLI